MVLQVALITGLLLSLSFHPLPALLLRVLMWLVLASTLISGACYVYQWGRRAWTYLSGSGR